MAISDIQHCKDITIDLIRSVAKENEARDLLELLERIEDITKHHADEKAGISLLLLASVVTSKPHWLHGQHLIVTIAQGQDGVQLGVERCGDDEKRHRVGRTYMMKTPIAKFRSAITRLQAVPYIIAEHEEKPPEEYANLTITLTLRAAPKPGQDVPPPGGKPKKSLRPPKNPSLKPPKNPSLRPKAGGRKSLKPKPMASPAQETILSALKPQAAPRIDLFASNPPDSDTSDIDKKWGE
jgi:hypothetical protein